MSQSKHNPFNSPIPKNFVQVWTSPLIPGLDDAASFDAAISQTSPLLETNAIEESLLREPSYMESIASSEADLIQSWLATEEEKSGIDSTSPSPSPINRGRPIFEIGSPSALADKENNAPFENLPPLHDDPFGGSFKFYETPSSDLRDMFSPIPSQRLPPKSSEKRSILADISSGSTVEFVPISWTTLYHCRPFENEPEQNKIAWLREACTHFRTSPTKHEKPKTTPTIFHLALDGIGDSSHFHSIPNNEKVVKTTPTNLSLTVKSKISTQFSPLSMPSGIQTGKRPSARSGNDASVRSILKSAGSNANPFGGGQQQRAVRFDSHRKAVKRPTIPQATPTTWPYAILPPRETGDTTTDYLFRDIWEDIRFDDDGKGKSNSSWVPYQTPNSTSTGSSSSGVARPDDNASSESKTTVIITGKENSLASVHSTATKSNEGSAKSQPIRRTPFGGKKLSYEHSSSERNILKTCV